MRIIGSDYDGTLNHNGIDAQKKKALKNWRDKGNVFVLISGRCLESLLCLYKKYMFPCDYLIANNGAVIMKIDGTVISDIRCSGRLVTPLLKLLFKKGCRWAFLQTDFPCKVYADAKECKGSYEYTLENMPKITYFNQISTCLLDVETAEMVTACVKEAFGDMLTLCRMAIISIL